MLRKVTGKDELSELNTKSYRWRDCSGNRTNSAARRGEMILQTYI